MKYFSGYKDAIPMTSFSKYRRMYFQLEDWMKSGEHSVCALLGPRKIGKTFALAQLCAKYSYVSYIDFKQHDDSEAASIIDFVEDEIKAGHTIILDEITYCSGIDIWLSRLANLMTGRSAKLIVTGSQQFAIKRWMYISFCSNADYVSSSFIDFEEFLVLSNKIHNYGDPYTPTVDDYFNYVTRSSGVLNVVDNTEYLKGHLEETIESQRHAAKNLDVPDVSEEEYSELVSLMYLILIKLHSNWTEDSFYSWNSAIKSIWSGYVGNLKYNRVEEILNIGFASTMQKIKRMHVDRFKVYLQFLLQCDMITFVLDSEDMFDAVAWIYGRDRTTLTLQEFFRRVTICFKHPIFYYNLIKELLQEADDPEKFIAGDVLGSILECNIRGVWSKFIKSPMMYEHHYFDNENNIIGEIDIYDDMLKVGIEITIRDKARKEVHLDNLPSDYKKVLFTKSRTWKDGNSIALPYPELCLKMVRASNR